MMAKINSTSSIDYENKVKEHRERERAQNKKKAFDMK